MLKLSLTVNWNEVHKERNALAGTTSQRFRRRSDYKDGFPSGAVVKDPPANAGVTGVAGSIDPWVS